MKRLPLAIPILLLGLALAPAVSADAPVGGPDQQYASFVGGDAFILDRWTKLQWERPIGGRMKIDEARAHCQTLGSQMRLPSMKELLTLVDEEPDEFYDQTTLSVRVRYIDPFAFPKTPPEEFWTMSPVAEASGGGARVWTVDFGTGRTEDALPTDERRVRCVRSL